MDSLNDTSCTADKNVEISPLNKCTVRSRKRVPKKKATVKKKNRNQSEQIDSDEIEIKVISKKLIY